MIVVIIVGEGEPTVDEVSLVKREVPWDLKIGFCVKKKINACPIVTGISKFNCLYNSGLF